MRTPRSRLLLAAAGLLTVAAACGSGGPVTAATDSPPASSEAATPPAAVTVSPPSPTPSGTDPAADSPAPSPAAGQERPTWLGTRILPERPDGLGEVQPTPPELVDRRLPPPNPDPVDDVFDATVAVVPADVLARSTWTEECPVGRAELRYLTITFWGFDQRTHLGEMIVHESVADEVVEVFKQLYDERFPIEEMRVVAAYELDAPPTGDGNNTSAFVCRPSTGGASWSQHAYGLAVDVNPFHNPYHRGDVVIPELASVYLDRSRDLPGMIKAGDAVTAAFASIGWGWGGGWNSSKDWMHFSQSGR